MWDFIIGTDGLILIIHRHSTKLHNIFLVKIISIGIQHIPKYTIPDLTTRGFKYKTSGLEVTPTETSILKISPLILIYSVILLRD